MRLLLLAPSTLPNQAIQSGAEIPTMLRVFLGYVRSRRVPANNMTAKGRSYG